MRVLIAPQEFKGSLSALEAAQAIAAGLARAQPAWELDLLPMSDGGPGFIEAVRAATRSDIAACVAHDALGRKVLARYLVVRDPRVAVVEAAQANGLLHLKPGELDALNAGTFGVGEVIAEALKSRPAQLLIGVGGSATTDGGAGMAQALGAHLTGADGSELPPGGGPLAGLARVEWTRPRSLDGVEVVVATDVTNPLTGPDGAAAVYGPQKGASRQQVELLDAALAHCAAVLQQSLGVDVSTIPGGGAAGGLAAGLVAFLGARIASGFDVVAGLSGLEGRTAQADLVVTGEGSFDSQSLQGKTTGRLIEMARQAGKPCLVFAGRTERASDGVATLSSLEPDPARAMAEAAALLAELVFRRFRSWPPA